MQTLKSKSSCSTSLSVNGFFTHGVTAHTRPLAQGTQAGRYHGDLAPADVAEISRLYALRSWIEQSYKQVKNSLGWAHYQVRKDISIRRHWQMVCCAFAFCWWEGSESLEDETLPGVVLQQKKPTPASEIHEEVGEGGKGAPLNPSPHASRGRSHCEV